MAVVQFGIPFMVLVFCYGTMLCKLSKRTSLSNISQIPQTQMYEKARRNVAITFCIVAFFYVFCWMPQQTVLFMSHFVYNVDWNRFSWHFVSQMIFLNCTINPFIYLTKSTHFQNALREFQYCLQMRNRLGLLHINMN